MTTAGRASPFALPRLTTAWLGTIARVRPEERRHVAAALLTLFGFMVGHALLETARDALFLASLPASQLPWVYLTIALVALALTQREPAVLRRLSTRHELSGWLLFASGVTFGLWLVIGLAGPWIFYVLYAWTGVLATLVVVRFWTVLGHLFTVTQAKRVFALIGSGSVVGAIVGSATARALTALLPARHVVAAAALVFVVSALGPTLLAGTAAPQRAPAAPRAIWDVAAIGRMVWARPYLRRVAVMILLATITFTLVDYVFKSTVARLVPDEELGPFFASVYLGLNVLSLAIQVFGVAWLLRRVGVNRSLALVPGLLLIGSIGYVIGGGLLLALLLKGTDGSLRHSLHRTGTELLFVPMSVDLRSRVKGVIDVLGQRGGQALASVIILTGVAVTTHEAAFAAIAAVTAAAWLHAALDLRHHYMNVFREELSKEITETNIEFPALDVASLETLVSSLNSADDRRVIAALDLLVARGKAGVVPALILYHPSSDVVVHALELFVRARRTDVVTIVERLLTHTEPRVRAVALRAHASLRPDERVLRIAADDPAVEVRVTATVALAAGGWLASLELEKGLEPTVAQGTPGTLRALAQAIRWQPAPLFERVLLQLADASDPSVLLEVVRAMRAVRSPAFLPGLIRLLAERELREDARAALIAFGPAAMAPLAMALRDATVAHAIRRHIPDTVARLGTPEAADLLVGHLLQETDGMIRFKILRALGRMRVAQPELPLDLARLGQALTQIVSTSFKFMRWRQALERGAARQRSRATDVHALLIGLLKDKQLHALERLMRLLHLEANNEDFLRIYRGLGSPRRESRAGSRELLEHLLVPPVRGIVLQLVDDLFELQSAPHPAWGAEEPEDEYETVLGELLSSGLESVSSLAAYHVAELRLSRLRPLLDRGSPLSPEHGEVLVRARVALATSGAAGS